MKGDLLQWNLSIWYSLLCWNRPFTSCLESTWSKIS